MNKSNLETYASERELTEKLEDETFAKKWIKENKKNKKKLARITGLTIKHDSTEALKNLLECGISPNLEIRTGSDRKMSLIRSCLNLDKLEAAKLLFDYKADANFCSLLIEKTWVKHAYFSETNVHRAINTNHIQFVDLFLSNNADLTISNVKGSNPLHTLCFCGQLEMLKNILRHSQSNVSIKIALTKGNRSSFTPLGMAVKRFIEEEKKVDVKNDCFEIIKLILVTFHGTLKSLTGSLKLYDSEFDEPIIFCLLRAVEECHLYGEDNYKKQIEQLLEIISILSNDEGQLSEKNHNGDYPIHYFASLGLINLLKKCPKFQFSLQNRTGWTSVHYAAESGQFNVIKFILETVSDKLADTKSFEGDYAYKIAEKNEKFKCAALILDFMSDVDGITCLTDGYSDFCGEDDLEESDEEKQCASDNENEFIVNTLDDEPGVRAVRFNDEGGSYLG